MCVQGADGATAKSIWQSTRHPPVPSFLLFLTGYRVTVLPRPFDIRHVGFV